MIWNLIKLNIFLNNKIFKRKNIIWKIWNLYVEMIFFFENEFYYLKGKVFFPKFIKLSSFK